MDHLPPINKVFSLVVQHERQKEISGSLSTMKNNASALFTKGPSISPSPSSYYRPIASSSSPRTGKPNIIRKDRPTCTHCGVYGHNVEKCYRLHGFFFLVSSSPKDSRLQNIILLIKYLKLIHLLMLFQLSKNKFSSCLL
jgi:hypothetical protein